MKTLRTRSSVFVLTVVFAAGLAWYGCGGTQSGGEGGETNETPQTTTTDTPAPTGDVSLAVGERVFKERCEMCHGAAGKGDGPAGMALNPRPRDMTQTDYMKNLTDQQIHDTILNGKAGTGMPPHQGLLTEAEVNSVILKVRSFSQS